MRHVRYAVFLGLLAAVFTVSCSELRDQPWKGEMEICTTVDSFSVSIGESVKNCKALQQLSIESYEVQQQDDSKLLMLHIEKEDQQDYADFLSENQTQRAVIAVHKMAIRQFIVFGTSSDLIGIRFKDSQEMHEFIEALRIK